MTATGPSRPCPSCGEPVYPGDHFCEACRAELDPSAPTPTLASTVCPNCQSTSFSADGYCESCGRKAPSPRDHSEIDLGQLAGVTDRGHRHYRNEDALAIAATEGPGGPASIAVVCDGVSGSDRGDEASQAAVQAALSVLLPAAQAGQDAEAASSQAVQAAQDAVAQLNGPRESSMADDAPSATFVSAVVATDLVTVCWLGDSRAYWLDGAGTSAARQLTTDDSLATELVTAGVLSEEEALASPQAHVVTGWLGADGSIRAPHVLRFVPPGPGVVMLCSDGLWNYLPDAAALAARAMPGAQSSPLATARDLVDFALEAGGHDNITVVLAPFPPKASRAPTDADAAAEPPTQPSARRASE